ncbi:RNA polymerase sigma-70 factor [Chitinophaga sp. XS-30]|uniref:RNA polymerase sigma-70 factor n=1 Tax=Chitinophaga sp. XS-30 TaxID=2604421 RepID=UPI0011DCB12D|nr:RNA polymerase sigma-70 factor [Chitinophaga sp. XS-30]QEH43440.1 RNA polymerase sigma-70 factor [Chitinophaga sp. XS-30]
MRNRYKISDEALLELMGQGDISAFEEIYNRYWAECFAAAYKRLGAREGAEETVQDFFTSMWSNRHTLKVHTSLKAYMHTSIRYLVISQIRREMVRNSYRSALKVTAKDYDNSAEETVMVKDLRSSYERSVRQLPTKCREAFELSRKAYKSNKEIAAIMGISEKTVENHITKALKILRVGLTDLTTCLVLLFFQ